MSEKFGFDCYDGNIKATNLASYDVVVHNAIFIKSQYYKAYITNCVHIMILIELDSNRE